MGMTLFSQIPNPRNGEKTLKEVLLKIARAPDNAAPFASELNRVHLNPSDLKELQAIVKQQDLSVEDVKTKAEELQISDIAPIKSAIGYLGSEDPKQGSANNDNNQPESNTPTLSS